MQLHEKLLEKTGGSARDGGAAVRSLLPSPEHGKETAVPVHNGIPASSLDASWTKSRHSNAEGNCVEVARVDGGVALRNSRDPDGPALVYTSAEVAAFLAGAKDGEFDHLV